MDERAHDITPGVVRPSADAATDPTSTTSDTVRIEAEIAQTRSEMQETISAIQDRLAPANVLQRAKETARDATVGRVKQMAHDFGHRAGDLTSTAYDSAAPRLRDNSMPLALIGIGLGWLVMRNWSHSRSMSPMVGTDWSENPWTEDEWEGGSRTITSRGEGTDTTSTIRDAAARSAERVRDVASTSAERVRSAASYGAERVTSTARSTQYGLERAIRDNPLAVGVATLAAGLAVGAMLPRTETEDEYLGTARDTVVHQARETAQGAIQQVTGATSQGRESAGPTV